jgi:glycosyltransferase involved in cell wall biosynthesis
VYRLYLAPFVDVVLDWPRRPPCVLDLGDVDSTTLRQLGDIDEAERFDRLERHYVPRFDDVLACSGADADEVAARWRVKAEVVPNAVRLPTHHASADPSWDLLFVGNLSYAPNVEAAQWLCREAAPLLPSATIALVGRDPAPAVQSLARDGHVFVSGTVDDVRPYYATSRIAVVPLRAGGGTSLKLLEAFAHRRPVVSTPVGARGIPVDDREHLLLAAAPADFAAACRRLLADPALATRLAAGGHNLVRDLFTIDNVSAGLAERLGRHMIAADAR